MLADHPASPTLRHVKPDLHVINRYLQVLGSVPSCAQASLMSYPFFLTRRRPAWSRSRQRLAKPFQLLLQANSLRGVARKILAFPPIKADAIGSAYLLVNPDHVSSHVTCAQWDPLGSRRNPKHHIVAWRNMKSGDGQKKRPLTH
jgi:hypothetical protein